MDVDQEIDELLSESDHAAPSSPARQEDPDVNTDCKWDDCCEACNTVEEIAQHLTEGKSPRSPRPLLSKADEQSIYRRRNRTYAIGRNVLGRDPNKTQSSH